MLHVIPASCPGLGAPGLGPERTSTCTFTFLMSSNMEISLKDERRHKRNGPPKRSRRKRREDKCAASSVCPSDRTETFPWDL